MKILLLILLITTNAFADFKIDIVNHEGQAMSKEFKTEIEADAYIAAMKYRWGRDAGWLNYDCGDSVETRIVKNEFDVDVTEYNCPATYSVIKTDITTQKQFEAIEKIAMAKLSCAKIVKAHVGALNIMKGKTKGEIQAIMATYKDVIELLDGGAVDTALEAIEALPTTPAIDQAYKDSVIAKVNNCNPVI